MTEKRALEKIYALPRAHGEPSLEPMRHLMALLHNPQKTMRYVHIAGTNGKGSTATMVAAILEAAGERVGLYTSPYINTFRERFRIGHTPVTIASFCEAARICFAAMEKMADADRLSQFDVVTAIGFLIFANAGCRTVVLECGLGGRFDATNIIDAPDVAVICNIGFDHTALLGNTIAAITGEKCGILKTGGGHLVVAPQDYPDALPVIDGYAAQNGLEVTRVSPNDIEILHCGLGSLRFSYRDKSYDCALHAAYQARNAATAIAVIEALGKYRPIPHSAIEVGLRRAYIPARLETLAMRPHVLLDGAHNIDGIRALRESFEAVLPNVKHIFCLVGMLEDKDPRDALSLFFASPAVREKLVGIATVTPNSPRACPADRLADTIRSLGLPESVRIVPFHDTRVGLYAILRDLRDDEALLCFGSLYMMGELRSMVREYYTEHKGGH